MRRAWAITCYTEAGLFARGDTLWVAGELGKVPPRSGDVIATEPGHATAWRPVGPDSLERMARTGLLPTPAPFRR
jgi:hypothetical protein